MKLSHEEIRQEREKARRFRLTIFIKNVMNLEPGERIDFKSRDPVLRQMFLATVPRLPGRYKAMFLRGNYPTIRVMQE